MSGTYCDDLVTLSMKRLRWLFFVREEEAAVELEKRELKKGMMVDVELVFLFR